MLTSRTRSNIASDPELTVMHVISPSVELVSRQVYNKSDAFVRHSSDNCQLLLVGHKGLAQCRPTAGHGDVSQSARFWATERSGINFGARPDPPISQKRHS